jgi:hypothetical protein
MIDAYIIHSKMRVNKFFNLTIWVLYIAQNFSTFLYYLYANSSINDLHDS